MDSELILKLGISNGEAARTKHLGVGCAMFQYVKASCAKYH